MTHPDHTPVLLLQLRAAGLPEPATEVRFIRSGGGGSTWPGRSA